MDENKRTSYRGIMKGTAIFGGVQVIQVLVSILRGKIVAVLLGTTGMGINNLFTSALNVITQISGLGINYSAVRDISKATENSDKSQVHRIIVVFKRWTYVCVALGVLLTLMFSPLLSKYSFGDYGKTVSFMFLSLYVLFFILNNSRITILQGLRQLKDLARVSLISAVCSLIVVLPFYYYWGIKGIIPALIVSMGVSFGISYWLSRGVEKRDNDIDAILLTRKEIVTEGKGMLKMGIVFTVSALIGNVSVYVINSFVATYGTISDVGLYSAGISITNQYIGLIITAMAVDYYPRLSSVCNDTDKVTEMVNNQLDVVLLIGMPLLIIMMATAPLLIRILLSEEFVSIQNFICILAFGSFFKLASFPMGFIAFAKGDTKTFFILEAVVGNVLLIAYNIIGYVLGGVTGIAISFAIGYVIYVIIITIVTRRLYKFKPNKETVSLFIKLMLFMCVGFVLTLLLKSWYIYIAQGFISVLACIYAYLELDKRIHIKELIKSRLKR